MEITAITINNVLLLFFVTASINKTKASKIHSFSNKNKPKSLRIEKWNIGSTKSKDIARSMAIDTTLALRP